MFLVLADQGILKNFTKACRDRSKLDIASRGQIFAHALHSLEDELPREVIVHAVFENHRDHAETDLRNGAHFRHSRESAHLNFNRTCNQFLHFRWRHSTSAGQDLHLHGRDIRKGIDRDTLPGEKSENSESDCANNDQHSLAYGKLQDAIDHVSPPPSRL